jgi:tryptophan-rich sensory protein
MGLDNILIVVPWIVAWWTRHATQQSRSFSYPKHLPLQPPGYVFGVMWTTLYMLFGVYLRNVFRTREPHLTRLVVLWVVNLALNVSWSPTVFGLKQYTTGVHLLLLMILSLVAMISFTSNNVSKLMLIPYLVWLLFALWLNVQLVQRESTTNKRVSDVGPPEHLNR